MIIKIVILGICVCLISVFLRQFQSSFLIIINIIFVISVIFLIFDSAVDSLKSINNLLDISSSASEMLSGLYKASAVCILTKITSDICKENGNTTVSDMIDLGGRIALLVISLPYIESVIKAATAFVT